MNYNNTFTRTNQKTYNNVIIRNLYAPDYSFLTMSFFKTNLAFGFTPYVGTDNTGRSQYDKNRYASTTVDYEGAAALYLAAKSILNGDERPTQLILPRGHQATLIFKYEPDERNQMWAYLILDKSGETIPFRFAIQQCQVKENAQIVTKIIQSGLACFEKTLEGYLTNVSDGQSTDKLQDGKNKYPF